jgi:hypothetical protein
VWWLTVATFAGVEHQHIIVDGRGVWVWAGAARLFDGVANSADGAASAFSLAGLTLGILMRAVVRESSHDGSVPTSHCYSCCTHHRGLICCVGCYANAVFGLLRDTRGACCWVAVLAAVELLCEVFWPVVQASSHPPSLHLVGVPACIWWAYLLAFGRRTCLHLVGVPAWWAYRVLASRTVPNTYNTDHSSQHATRNTQHATRNTQLTTRIQYCSNNSMPMHTTVRIQNTIVQH